MFLGLGHHTVQTVTVRFFETELWNHLSATLSRSKQAPRTICKYLFTWVWIAHEWLEIRYWWKGDPFMKSTPKMIIGVFCVFFSMVGQLVLLETKRFCSLCASKRKTLGHLTLNMEATLQLQWYHPGVAASGYAHFFLLTTVSTTVKSFGCKSSDKRYVSQQSAGTN